jgi:hypothetical protein
LIPADHLSGLGRNDRADDAEEGRHDKT